MRTLAWTLAGIYLVGMGWMWWEVKHAMTHEEWLASRYPTDEGDEG